jgi:hypothetical protein
MRAGQDVLSDLRAALGMEWVLPHGTGGSSSGTACGANARRAHALLTASGPHGRLTTLLLKVDERLRTPYGAFELSCSVAAGGAARPAGHLLLESFAVDPWPRWTWRAGGAVLEKALLPITGHDAVAIRYRLLEGPAVTLSVSPLAVARDPDGLQRESAELHAATQGVPGRVQLQLAADRPPLTLWHNGAFLPARVWQHGIQHPLEAGKDEAEDAFVPGHVEAAIEAGAEFHLVAASEPDLFRALAREDRLGAPPPRTLAECVRILESAERELHAGRESAAVAAAAVTAAQAAQTRERGAAEGEDADGATHGDGAGGADAAGAGGDAEADPWTARLSNIVLSGLARGPRGLTIVDSLLAARRRGAGMLRIVPALLTLRAYDAAREILADVAEHLDEGRAPEDFDPGDGSPRYGDPAPSLWLVYAAELYARRSGDLEYVREVLYAPLESVIQAYRAGTRDGIHTGEDGLLAAGEHGERRADLNALWYHALVAMAQLAKKTERKEAAAFYLAWAREHQTRFNETLWDEKRGLLFDAIGERGPVRGPSPAQLLAARIGPPVLPPERLTLLVQGIERALFTPLGLRAGPRATRVHTEWLGPFYSAYLRDHARSAESQAQVRAWLRELHARLVSGVGGTLPEWFEIAPVASRGTKASAGEPLPESVAGPPVAGGDPVSVLAAAELLPVWIEGLDHAPSAAAILTG